MASQELVDLMRRAEQLSPEEQRQLLQYLTSGMHQQAQTPTPGWDWDDIRGTIPPDFLGMDAQEWISQGRQEGDAQRAAQYANEAHTGHPGDHT